MGYAGNQPQYGTFPSDLFTGNGSNTNFTMSSVPGNDAALLVTVDGVRQHTDTYSYSANTLTFSEAPGSGAIIEVVNMGSRADVIITEGVYKKTQFTATAAQTNFTIPTGYTVGFVDVYLNGIRLVVADDYTATDGSTIILATPAVNGDSVEVVAYGTFNVANALLKSGDTMSGNLVVSGTSTLTAPVAIANTTGNTVVFAANGNVGISVTNPGSPLVVSAAAGASAIKLQGIASNGNSRLDYFDSAGATQYFAVSAYNAAVDLYAYTAIPMIFSTNATERMRIDSSGRVTMPYQPSFSVRKTGSNFTPSGSSPIIFDSVFHNIGSCYSTSTGRFTAPVAGVYCFVFECLTDGVNSTAADFRFFKNGTQTEVATIYLSGYTSSYRKGSMTGLIQLALNVYVTVQTESGGTSNPLYAGTTGHTSFKGYLIG